jgi:hypothetical protein
MEFTCQRCGETLSTDAAFCPHCAAPQVRWIEPEPDAGETADASQPEDSPQPHRGVYWDSAIRLALLTSIVTGLLCSFLSLGTLLWIACGAGATIVLYRRRYPSAAVDAHLGSRVGFLFGLFTAVIVTISDAGIMLFQRDVLHQTTRFDQAYSAMLVQVAGRAPTNPATLPQWTALMQFWHLPEARAGLYVFSAAFFAFLVIILSGAAGAIMVRFKNVPFQQGGHA